jgi:3'5'-cyclic nucleotide phosphodiesterase
MAEANTPYIGIALGITSQAWTELGNGEDPAIAPSSDISVVAERITAMILIRIIAWIQPRGTFSDLSTTTICRELLTKPSCWPDNLSQEATEQLKTYVHAILAGYNDVPYHNFEHCYHVVLSTNKLVDMILNVPPGETAPCTFGFRDDPLMQLALIYSALIHDVEHLGIPNRQLAVEDDSLALLYNDQSIAEMRSLCIGFSTLLKPDYESLRKIIFPFKQDYLRFRATVIDLVLTTDLASPDRAQIAKSKWKEAFGDEYETVERKVMKAIERRQSLKGASRKASTSQGGRRMSAYSIMSELSLDSTSIQLNQGLSDDESASLTPDNSDAEEESPALRTTGTNFDKLLDGLPRRKSLDVDQSIRSQASGNLSGMALKYHRRLSSLGGGNTTMSSGKPPLKSHSTRLGLLRTVDLSGEPLEMYQKQAVRASATGEMCIGGIGAKTVEAEEVDQLRETVVMEVIIRAADVAHNLQSFEQMAKWSNRLFLELKRAYVRGRGPDPQDGWFKNQTVFLEAYLLPLARKLDDIGAFGETTGSMFAKVVEECKERWLMEGASFTTNIIREGHLRFPEEDSGDEAP